MFKNCNRPLNPFSSWFVVPPPSLSLSPPSWLTLSLPLFLSPSSWKLVVCHRRRSMYRKKLQNGVCVSIVLTPDGGFHSRVTAFGKPMIWITYQSQRVSWSSHRQTVEPCWNFILYCSSSWRKSLWGIYSQWVHTLNRVQHMFSLKKQASVFYSHLKQDFPK